MEIYPITFWCFILAFVIFIVTAALRGLRGDYSGTSKETEASLDAPIELPPAEAIGATVLSKRWEIAKNGRRTGNVAFFVTFLTDDGETVEHEVQKELFDRLADGESAMLVTVEGKFIDFGDGENIE